MNLYRIKYANGLNGYGENLGSVYVVAQSVAMAKNTLSVQLGVKVSHIGKVERLECLVQEVQG